MSLNKHMAIFQKLKIRLLGVRPKTTNAVRTANFPTAVVGKVALYSTSIQWECRQHFTLMNS